MTSINFDNPYLLLIGIPLFLLVLVPYVLAIRKENRSKSTVISLILHTLIIAIVCVTVAGIHTKTVVTKTEVVVVADASHSTDRDAEKIDGYIKNIISQDNLPENTRFSVVCFGKDAHVNTPFDGSFKSIKVSKVDNSTTDVSAALEYASGLFSNDVIKRIVLITDGEQNTVDGAKGIINSIRSMEAKDILVDAVFVDSNLNDGEYEVQLMEMEYAASVYEGEKSYLHVTVRSNSEYIPNENNPKDKNDAFVRVYNSEGELLKEVSKPLLKGNNLVTIELDTELGEDERVKTNDYRVVVEANHDTSKNNNENTFTQQIVGEIRVLLVSRMKADYQKAKELYGDKAIIDKPIIDNKDVPCMLEELCAYDVFILSDVDVKTIKNGEAFVTNLNTAVSKFGKTLIMAGNTYVQNKSEPIYELLGGMSAINNGNSSGDSNLYAIVIDSSRSMQDASQLIMAKASAIQLLELMKPGDQVMILSVSGDVSLVSDAVEATKNKEYLKEVINSIKPTQGTVLSAGLRLAYDQMAGREGFSKKHVLLISDGRDEGSDEGTAYSIATKLYNEKLIYISCINTASPVGDGFLKEIAKRGQGNKEGVGYFFVANPEQVVDTVTTNVADNLYQTVIVGDTPVRIKDYGDALVSGISTLPNIGGFYFGEARADSTVVLEAIYSPEKGVQIPVPLYSYKNYENGKVISLSTKFSGDWMSAWSTDVGGIAVFTRMLNENIPVERIDYPFTFNVELDGVNANIEIVPGEANPDITVDLEIISPSGESVTQTLYYENGVYTTVYEITEAGKYYTNVAYTYGDKIFPASISFDVAYMPEYDRFITFDSATLYNSLGEGVVSENGEVKIEADKDKEIITTEYFIIPLMFTAVSLYVIDVIIRKIKWSDIVSLFGKGKSKKGEVK